MGIIVFNNIPSSEVGVVVEHFPDWVYPSRDVEVYHVPGRNGDVIIDSGSYQNVVQPFEIAFGDYDERYTPRAYAVSKWLHSATGYARLETSYEPEYYRMAYYQEENGFDNILMKAGRSTVNFICKPQKFLKSGEKPISITERTTLYNPTGYIALPTIDVYGTGAASVTVGEIVVKISDIKNHITIDCEEQNAFDGSVNRNADISIDYGKFPKLNPGDNIVTFTGSVTKMEVKPNWWTL